MFSRTSRDWRALVAAICVAQATAIVGFDFTLPFIPLYLQNDLGVHGLGAVALWSGLIGFGPSIPATIFGPVWGKLADRLGYRFMLLRAMICASIILAMMGLSPSPWILLGLRMLQGALTGTVFAAQALVASAVPEKETGRSIGLLQMSVFIGATMGPLGGGAVAALLDYRYCYLAAGLLLALATLVVYLFAWEPARAAHSRTTDEAVSMLSVIAIPAFGLALALVLISQLAGTAMFPIIPLYVQDLLHSARNVAPDTGWLMAAAGLTAGAGSYLAGRLQRHLPLKPLVGAAVLLSALLLIPQAFVQSYTELLIVRCVATIAFGGLVSLVGMLAATTSPARAKGTAFGLMGAASSMGFGAGPLLGGALTATLGIRPIFVLAGLFLAGAPIALLGAAALPRLIRTSFSPGLSRSEGS
ncbi:MAG TPA: MFS transporter [Chloroflexota bacterium]|nr:MFS transporter [Chloroflexota bacterium]